MSNHANYAKIGFTVVLGIVATVAVLVYLGGAVGDDDIFYAETYYDTSVSGLSVGSAVNFRGVKVGEVKEISFVGAKYEGVPWADAQRIYIRMALFSKSLGPDARNKTEEFVKRGMRATVTASGRSRRRVSGSRKTCMCRRIRRFWTASPTRPRR